MSADTTLMSCPRCGSSVRRSSDWCTLCFADLRPVPPPRVAAPVSLGTPAQAPPPPVESIAPDPLPTPLAVAPALATAADADLVTLPCPTCQSPVLLEVAVCAACGSGLFDRLREPPAEFKLPVLGDVMAMSKGARMALAVVTAGFAIAVLIALVTLLGAVL